MAWTVSDNRTCIISAGVVPPKDIDVEFYVTEEEKLIQADITVNDVLIGSSTTNQNNPLTKTYKEKDILNIVVTKKGYETYRVNITLREGVISPYPIWIGIRKEVDILPIAIGLGLLLLLKKKKKWMKILKK